ncbi:unnamed protein product [Auanema sp. JU1783]|nr:unnamed protein product [Auanema sp. JU1783]
MFGASTGTSTGLFSSTPLGKPTTAPTTTPLLSSNPLASTLKPPTSTTDEKLLFSDLETVVNNLTMEVAHLERSFLSQALEINAYDRVVRENERKLINADKEITNLEASRDRLNYNLGFIDEQHAELENLVSDIEKKLGLPDWTDYSKPYPIDMSCASSADEQRRKIMQLLTTVDAQLKEAGDDIDEIIGQVSSLVKEKENVSSNVITVEHIQKVLKKQLENLVWLDSKSEELNVKTSKLSRSLTQEV